MFYQQVWLKAHIDLNSELRKNSNKYIERDF